MTNPDLKKRSRVTYLCIFFKGGRIILIALNVHANGGTTAARTAQTENDS